MGALFGNTVKANSAVQQGSGPVQVVGPDQAMKIVNERLPAYQGSTTPVATLEAVPVPTKGAALGGILSMANGQQPQVQPPDQLRSALQRSGLDLGDDPTAPMIDSNQHLNFAPPSAPQAATHIVTPTYRQAVGADDASGYRDAFSSGLTGRGKALAFAGNLAQGALLGAGGRTFGEGAERAMLISQEMAARRLRSERLQQEMDQQSVELQQNKQLFPLKFAGAKANLEQSGAETELARTRNRVALRPDVKSIGRGGVISTDVEGRTTIVRQPDRPTPNRWSVYLDANGGDAEKATKAVTDDAIRRALAGRASNGNRPGELSAGLKRAIDVDPEVAYLRQQMRAADKRQSSMMTQVDPDEHEAQMDALQARLQTRVTDLIARSSQGAGSPTPTPKTIKIIGPDGIPYTIPAANKDKALSQGAKLAN